MALSLPQAEEFQALFLEALPDDWKPTELGRERFGSWEWLATNGWDDRGPSAWAVFAATPIDAVDERARWLTAEAWAIAEWDDRFRREVVASTEIDVSDGLALHAPLLTLQIRLATARAETWRADDLVDTVPDLEPPAAAEPAPTEILARILELVRARPGITLAELAEQLGTSRGIVAEPVFELAERGLVLVETQGRGVVLYPTRPQWAG